MKLTFKVFTASLFFSIGVQAQTQTAPKDRGCATQIPAAAWDTWFNQKVAEYQQNLAGTKTQSTNYTIPVIVHVIHGGQNVGSYPNLSQAQINSQITVLNNDFAGIGLNANNLAATGFSTVGAADCSISFCPAQIDPSGNTLAEPGINRVNYATNAWTNPASITSQSSFRSYVDGVIKPGTIWDPTRYFNIWITDRNTNVNLLGYATFPIGTGLIGIAGTGQSTNDGIYVWSRAYGSTGVLSPPYNRGRTATHEVGHWLGLRHIWGDANCGNDFCNDTPVQQTSNFGCKIYPANTSPSLSCGSAIGDMFMNFMDYSDDACLYMFTPNQSARMNTAMTNGTFRNQLTASSANLCDNVSAVIPFAAFSFPTTVACIDSIVTINNQSTGTPPPTYSWSVNPNLSGTFNFNPNINAVMPNITFAALGTFTVTVFATNAAGTASSSKVITINDCSTVGFKNNSSLQKSIVLSPNPSSGVVNITTASAQNQNLEVAVHNYLGEFVISAIYKDANLNAPSLDLNAYANGVYFISINNGIEKIVKRVILNK